MSRSSFTSSTAALVLLPIVLLLLLLLITPPPRAEGATRFGNAVSGSAFGESCRGELFVLAPRAVGRMSKR